MLYKEEVKLIYLKLFFYSFIEMCRIWDCPFLKISCCSFWFSSKHVSLHHRKSGAVGMNNLISYPCVTCLLSWVTALLEMLVRKPSSFKILLCDCHLLFTFCLHVSEWNQWCQTLLCSQLYSLKIFHFCNTEDMVLNLFVVFHASNVSLYTGCITVALWAAQLCLRQKVAQ